jgi:putative peptidoglycan lipid II flippase
MSIFGATVAAILLPKFSKNFHSDDEKKSFEKGISDSLNAVVILLLPVVILFIFHGVSIIRIIYQRGVFNFNDTLMTSSLLNILALGLVFYASYSVINKILYSAQMLRSFLFLVIISVASKYFVNLYFVDVLKQNALALSTVLSYSILLIGGIGILVYKLKLFFYKEYLKNLFYLSILAMLIFLISKLILKIFLTESLFFEIFEMLIFVVIYFSTIYFADNSNNSITKKVLLSFGKSFNK